MAATSLAMYRGQPGATLLAAFPQSPQTSTLNEDLIQIRGVGGATLALVNYTGTVIGPLPAGSLTLTSVAVSSFAVSNIAFAGGINTITGVFTGGSSAWVGLSIALLLCTTPANNGTYTILSANTTTITVANAAGVSEVETATASVYTISTATYNGTITGGGTNALVNQNVTVAGFTNAINNVSSVKITASTGSTIVVAFAGQIAETHAGTATLKLPTTGQRTRIGRFQTNLASGSTLAQLFANVFDNPANLDILQVVNEGGNVSYYLNYLGVATGS
jgi:hypothetical protein